MFGPTPLRDILLVAGFELREMLRTRRALIILAIYVLGGLAAAFTFVEFLKTLEAAAATALGASATETPGALTKQLMADPAYRRSLRRMFSSNDVADYLLGMPPICLFYAFSSFMFVPILIMLTASDTIAQERQSRGIRFIAFRTGRVEFVLGKTLGQGLLMALVTLLTAFAYLAVAWTGLQGFELGPTLSGMFTFWPRVVVYSAPFLGLCALCSTNASSTNTARAFSLIALATFWALHRFAYVYRDSDLAPVWAFVDYLLPYSHRDDLWSPHLQVVSNSGLNLMALCAMYLVIGLLIFRRRDV